MNDGYEQRVEFSACPCIIFWLDGQRTCLAAAAGSVAAWLRKLKFKMVAWQHRPVRLCWAATKCFVAHKSRDILF